MTCEELLKALVGVGLLTDEDAQSVNQRLASTSGKGMDAGDLAGRLVRASKLTQFQANQVLAGKAKALVLGDYVLLDRIGAGGMGQVFQAQHRRMKRVVALKLLPAAMLEDAAAVRRFQREVEAAAKLVHPNIVISYDAGQARGQHYLVMEYVNGKDLLIQLKEKGAFSVDQALDYILQAARGLAYAHSEGVVHRDIKPANLLLDGKGTVKILDMGLARIDDAAAAKGDGLTQTGQVMGTVDYMAPEQAFDTHAADARADIYSLGCTLFRLLVNENMFGGDSLVKKLLAHREGAIPPLRSKRPDVSQQLDSVYQRMVAKKPDQRFQTMAEVIEALEACRAPAHAHSEPSGLVALSGLKFSPRGGGASGIGAGSGIGASSGIGGGSNSAIGAGSGKLESGSGSALQPAANQGTVGNLNSDVPTDPKNPGLQPAPGDATERQPGWKRRGVLLGAGGAALAILLGMSLVVYLLTRGSQDETPIVDQGTTGVPGTDQVVAGPLDDGKAKAPDDAGKAKPAASPTVASVAHIFSPPTVTPTSWHNLLEPVNVPADAMWGDWLTVSGQGLQATANASNTEPDAAKSAMLVLPIAPVAEYQLRMKLRFASGDCAGALVLPVGKGQVAFSLKMPEGAARSGFEQIDGKRASENATATSVVQPGLGATHQLDLIVLPRQPDVELYALWNGKPASHWKGPVTKLSPITTYKLAGEPAIGLVSEGSTVVFESVELGLITGDVRYRRSDVPQLALNVQSDVPAPPPMTVIPTAELTSNGIDLLKLVDPAKHSFRGMWKRDGALLESDLQANGSGIFFPIYPPAEYRMELLAERVTGQDCFVIGLASGATEFGVFVDDFTSTGVLLASLDGKGNAVENPTYKKHAAFSPGRIVRLRCEVGPQVVRYLEDGALVLEWRGDFSRLGPDGYSNSPERRTLCLVAHSAVYRIYEARLLPLDAPEIVWGPEPSALAAAMTAIHAEFKDEFDAAKRPEQQATLAMSLLDAAQKSHADPARQLALCDESRRLAVAGGDLTTAMTALRLRHARFPLDFLMEAAALVEGAPYSPRADENIARADQVADLVEQAVQADRFDAALRLGNAGMTAVRKTNDGKRTKRLTDRLADIKDMSDEYARLSSFAATLKTTPDDPAANAAIGRFRCFWKCDWPAGLKNLALGSDATLKAAALKELENPQAAASQATLATQWWDIGAKLPRDQRKNAIRHAAEWYLESMEGLSATQRASALTRIDEAARSEPPPLPSPQSLNKGLVAYWGFEEGRGRLATDAVAKSHALLHNAQWSRGVSGGGLHFTGPDQYAEIPFVGKSDEFTVALWAKVTPSGSEIPLFVSVGNKPGAVQLWADNAGGPSGNIQGRVGHGSNVSVDFGKWNHLAITGDGGTIVVYLNGVEVTRNAGGKTDSASTPRLGPARIGMWHDDSLVRHIRGTIDDVRVYSTALPPQAIAILVNSTAPASRE